MRRSWGVALGGSLLAGCTALLPVRVPLEVPPGLAASKATDAPACVGWSDGAQDEKIAFAGCMIARGYGAAVDVRPARLARSVSLMIRRTTAPPDAQTITDLVSVCRTRVVVGDPRRQSVVDSTVSSLGAWVPGDQMVEGAAARFRECLEPAGFSVTRR